VVSLYPYQLRWVQDRSRFKLAVKATQIGFSFAAALEAVLDCLEHQTLWIVLSRGERQSLEFMEKVKLHMQALAIAAAGLELATFGEAQVRELSVRFPNGSRIIGLPANADTARGYSGNMILDEFAFHQQDREIWAAAFGRISRGDLKLRVISTPNGQRGKYYELAKACGLNDQSPDRQGAVKQEEKFDPSLRGFPTPALRGKGMLRAPISASAGAWSGHWCDIHTAVAEGCPADIDALRRGIADEETWQQEYECVFLSGRDNYLPLDLILTCEDPQATTSLPPGWEARAQSGELYFGYDVARVSDLAVLAVIEKLGDVFWLRGLIEMPAMKFSDQEKILTGIVPHCLRGAVDATGMGSQMAERLSERFPGQVEPVSFTSGRKQEMAVRLKRCFEDRVIRIPAHAPLRNDLSAVKRTTSSAGNIRFDAEHSDEGHADRFWALALALQAAERGRRAIAAGSMDTDSQTLSSRGARFLSDEGSALRFHGGIQ
jgi:phage FluMu gp28-like protein